MKQYTNFVLGAYEYITAPAVERDGYQVGRVNAVKMVPCDDGSFELTATDGYKLFPVWPAAQNRDDAIAAARRLISTGFDSLKAGL